MTSPFLPPTDENSGRQKDDGQLDHYIGRIAQKDSSALADLYRDTNVAVYGFALSMLRNSHDAQDVMHDTYLRVYSSAQTYQSQGKPLAWILTITKNLCRMKLRERQKQADVSIESVDKLFYQFPSLSAEDKITLHACLNSLNDSERQIVMLYSLTGLKHRQIAEILSLPLSTVLSKYNRAIKKMRLLIERENRDEK